MLEAIVKTHFKRASCAISGHKKQAGWLADKAVRPACFVLCLILTPLFFELDILQINIIRAIYFAQISMSQPHR
jgi:hypothetical protein